MKLAKPAVALGLLAAAAVQAQTNVVSTQMRPVEEAEKVRTVILKGATEPGQPSRAPQRLFSPRMKADWVTQARCTRRLRLMANSPP